ncbi:OLC1v1024213C1 [Oldenlandia corymbosa var. corymbosa]|uniref:OLC1v1024213C1 n=1 Tax=Oldenlandia corymbosa var. corymbosa TaxID=529605 RepID=A0AAV1C266_OLDCO|nr:OLC1v1024213C1 [Oldenlandia corymbosa var. corymbosa]
MVIHILCHLRLHPLLIVVLMVTEEELEAIIGRLTLRESESTRYSTCSLNPTRIDPFLTIVGKLQCPRVVSHDSIATNCRNIWSVRNGFTVRPVGENTVHFKFNDRIDRARVLHGEPWLLGRKHVLVLKPSDTLDVDSNIYPWWKQLHNYPLDLMNADFAKFAGDLIAQFQEVFTDVDRNCIGKEITIPLRYERLAEWCYYCGIIGHVENNCLTRPPNAGSSPPEYSSWLKAKGYWNPFVSRRPANEPDPFYVPDESDEEVAPWSERQEHHVTLPYLRNPRNSNPSHTSPVPSSSFHIDPSSHPLNHPKVHPSPSELIISSPASDHHHHNQFNQPSKPHVSPSTNTPSANTPSHVPITNFPMSLDTPARKAARRFNLARNRIIQNAPMNESVTIPGNRKYDIDVFDGYDLHMLDVEVIGKKHKIVSPGGLAMLWRKDVAVSLRSYSKRFIDVDVDLNGNRIRATGIYGQPDVSLRRDAWSQYDSLYDPAKKPWIFFGDFNEDLMQNEFQGCGKQIRSGMQTSIWYDKWIPVEPSFCTSVQSHILSPTAVVSELLIPGTNEWNQELVRDLFPQEEANAILSMVLPQNQSHDRWIWHHTRKGNHTVRSAYYQLLYSPEFSNGSISLSITPRGVQDPLWRTLWSFKLPNRILLFAWRLSNNSFPTVTNLAARHLDVPSDCALCQQNSLSSCHQFFVCQFAVQVFRIAGLHQSIMQYHHPICEQWFRAILLDKNFSHRSFFIALLSGIWQARNSLMFEQQRITLWSVVLQASRIVHSFQSLSVHQESSNDRLQCFPFFQASPADAISVCFDGAIFHIQHCAGAGIIVRDQNGAFMFGLAR